MIKSAYSQGLVRTVILIVVAIIVLSFFGFNLRSIVESDLTQDNLGYAKELVVRVWEGYLSKPVLYFWNNIFVGLIWESFLRAMQNVRNGESLESQFPRLELPQFGTAQ
jgi:hypothetical protein